MVRTTSLYEACQELFTEYPLAARAADHSDAIRSMVLVLREDEDARFFLLSRDCGDGAARYSLCPWPGGDAVDIEADEGVPVPDVVAKAVTPRPAPPSWLHVRMDARGYHHRTGRGLHGVRCGQAAAPLDGDATRVGTPKSGVATLHRQALFRELVLGVLPGRGHRFLGGVIAASANTVFWVNTQAILGSDCCIVARDIGGPGRRTLQRGCYAYSEVLRAGKRVPSLAALLVSH